MVPVTLISQFPYCDPWFFTVTADYVVLFPLVWPSPAYCSIGYLYGPCYLPSCGPRVCTVAPDCIVLLPLVWMLPAYCSICIISVASVLLVSPHCFSSTSPGAGGHILAWTGCFPTWLQDDAVSRYQVAVPDLTAFKCLYVYVWVCLGRVLGLRLEEGLQGRAWNFKHDLTIVQEHSVEAQAKHRVLNPPTLWSNQCQLETASVTIIRSSVDFLWLLNNIVGVCGGT